MDPSIRSALRSLTLARTGGWRRGRVGRGRGGWLALGTLPDRGEPAQMRLLFLAEILAHLGQIGVELDEGVGADAEDLRLGHASYRGVAGQVAAQQREVAEMVAGPQPINHLRRAVGPFGHDLHGTGLDDVN